MVKEFMVFGCTISQNKGFGSWSEHPDPGPKSIEIGMCWFVGTAPGILGSASFGLGVDVGHYFSAPVGALIQKQKRFKSNVEQPVQKHNCSAQANSLIIQNNKENVSFS